MSWDVLITLLWDSVRSQARLKSFKVLECNCTRDFIARENCCFSEMNEDSNVGFYGRHIISLTMGERMHPDCGGRSRTLGPVVSSLLLTSYVGAQRDETENVCQTASLFCKQCLIPRASHEGLPFPLLVGEAEGTYERRPRLPHPKHISNLPLL